MLVAHNDEPATDNGVAPVALFDRALTRLETVYYKPFGPQTPLQGERTAIVHYLQGKNIARPSVPTERATGDPDADAQRMADVVASVEQRYGKKLGSDVSTNLTEVALTGVMDSVDDPYTVYLTPKQIESLNESLNGGDFGGIGVYIYKLKDGEVILQPIDGAPASRAGMKAGEIVDTVDGRAVRGAELDKVEQWIRGASGSTVVLTTHPYKSKQEHRYTITRAIIHVPTVAKKMEDGYDYIRLSDFGSTSPAEIKSALLYGSRTTPRGIFSICATTAAAWSSRRSKSRVSLFPRGPSFRPSTARVTARSKRRWATPSAAAAARRPGRTSIPPAHPRSRPGALQDYHLAKLVGTKTFGKGVMQSIYDMPDGGALKITPRVISRRSGARFNTTASRPTSSFRKAPMCFFDTPADKQLAAAKAQLAQLLSK